MSDLLHEHAVGGERHRDLPLFIALFLVIVVVSVVALGTSFVWAKQYDGRIAPNVWIGSLPVGGLDPETAKRHLQERADTLLTQGIVVVLEGESRSLPLAASTGTDIVEDATLDLDAVVSEAMSLSQGDNDLARTLLFIRLLAQPKHLRIPVDLNNARIESTVRTLFPNREQLPHDATFRFTRNASGWGIQIEPDASGHTFHFERFFVFLKDQLTVLSKDPIPLLVTAESPTVSLQDASKSTGLALATLEQAPYTFTYTSELLRQTGSWKLSAQALSEMLTPQAGGRLGIDSQAFNAFLDPIAASIEVEARDAKFQVENGRVVEFEGSKEGIAIDREPTREAFLAAITGDETSVVLHTKITTPEHSTSEVNDLGITEVLGVGVSNFRGSPRNRIRNIRNGVKLLNGTLIAPGTTFSLLKALGPFTAENGYLPELVIKGDKIEPEIGGGLCQIGTTTFRATMLSGLPIAERSNHSLVVSYYNDKNGNPGTDATIYEPAPDFKFINDTGNAILFEAEMLEESQELHFTFWGTSDGRKGSYSAPVVLRWLPTGEPKMVETLDLPPGEQQCQSAHVGADASFTYTIEKPDGEKEERVFLSHYRPLPKTCLVGVEALSTLVIENPPPITDGSSPAIPLE